MDGDGCDAEGDGADEGDCDAEGDGADEGDCDAAGGDGDVLATGAVVVGALTWVTTSTAVAAPTTATRAAVTYMIRRLSRLRCSRRSASSRRRAARLRLTFRCDMDTPEKSSGDTIGGRV
ncbi:hypothetical protein EDD27_4250 [Nonomuraea polychroma]|uniref:Uncharacterized protein n=1 Tax=Nonomuraea polychroma TaxID=46176 RepID=A0A438M7U8_9ACTN|nr:hypothetical protein [Nonomuraea polychroma]RVX41685.1 hypothetical protein EDD27_4250 [Nonomuraea polychroma]